MRASSRQAPLPQEIGRLGLHADSAERHVQDRTREPLAGGAAAKLECNAQAPVDDRALLATPAATAHHERQRDLEPAAAPAVQPHPALVADREQLEANADLGRQRDGRGRGNLGRGDRDQSAAALADAHVRARPTRGVIPAGQTDHAGELEQALDPLRVGLQIVARVEHRRCHYILEGQPAAKPTVGVRSDPRNDLDHARGSPPQDPPLADHLDGPQRLPALERQCRVDQAVLGAEAGDREDMALDRTRTRMHRQHQRLSTARLRASGDPLRHADGVGAREVDDRHAIADDADRARDQHPGLRRICRADPDRFPMRLRAPVPALRRLPEPAARSPAARPTPGTNRSEAATPRDRSRRESRCVRGCARFVSRTERRARARLAVRSPIRPRREDAPPRDSCRKQTCPPPSSTLEVQPLPSDSSRSRCTDPVGSAL